MPTVAFQHYLVYPRNNHTHTPDIHFATMAMENQKASVSTQETSSYIKKKKWLTEMFSTYLSNHSLPHFLNECYKEILQ